MTLFINIYLKIFMILTPFFVISAFISITRNYSREKRRRTAFKVSAAVILASFTIYLFGRYIFDIFGITLDAFRIGAGAVLFLSAVQMIQGKGAVGPAEEDEDVAVVPLAIPITVGPGVIGALMVMGADLKSIGDQIVASAALLCAALTVGGMLLAAGGLEKLVGRQGLVILSKLTGLFVASIAAQIFFTGLGNFMAAPN